MSTNTLSNQKTKNNQDQGGILKAFKGWILFCFAPLFMALYDPYWYFTEFHGFLFNLACVYTYFFFVKTDKNDGWEWYSLIGYAAVYYSWIRYVAFVTPGFFCFMLLLFGAKQLHAAFRKDEWIAQTENKEFQDKIEMWLDRIFISLLFFPSVHIFLNLGNVMYWTCVYFGVWLAIDRFFCFLEWRRSKKYNYPFTWD